MGLKWRSLPGYDPCVSTGGETPRPYGFPFSPPHACNSDVIIS